MQGLSFGEATRRPCSGTVGPLQCMAMLLENTKESMCSATAVELATKSGIITNVSAKRILRYPRMSYKASLQMQGFPRPELLMLILSAWGYLAVPSGQHCLDRFQTEIQREILERCFPVGLAKGCLKIGVKATSRLVLESLHPALQAACQCDV